MTIIKSGGKTDYIIRSNQRKRTIKPLKQKLPTLPTATNNLHRCQQSKVDKQLYCKRRLGNWLKRSRNNKRIWWHGKDFKHDIDSPFEM